MKHANTQITEKMPSCYGAFSEQWKYDDYTRRKNWFKRNRRKIIAATITCCVLAMIAAFLLVK